MICIDYWQSAELAAAVLGLEAPETHKAIKAIEDQFVEKYEIDLNTFSEIAERLLPLCAMDKSPLTDTFRKGFVLVVDADDLLAIAAELEVVK
jgi:hypothetical protein